VFGIIAIIRDLTKKEVEEMNFKYREVLECMSRYSKALQITAES
jgi:hypothetical protein